MSKLQVKSDVFSELGVGAGLLLSSAPTINESTNAITITDASIIGATRGGFTFNPNPQTRARVVDGLASNTVGAHTIDRYEPTLAGTFITADLATLKKACGFGDISDNELTFRHDVKSEDYFDVWFIQMRSDGGAIILKLSNASCAITAGSLKTTDAGETEISLTFVGNYTIADQDTPPFSIQMVDAPVTPTPTPTEQTQGSGTSNP